MTTHANPPDPGVLLKVASIAQGRLLRAARREGRLNDLNRTLVRVAKAAWGTCWLGKFQRRDWDRDRPYLWEWSGGTVKDRSADFVVPAFDERLAELVHERTEAPWEGVARDADRLDAIMDRVRFLGGEFLVWR